MKKLTIILFVFLALTLSACVSLAEDITPPPNAQSSAPMATEEPMQEAAPAEDVDAAALFEEYCAVCHGKDGKGISVNVDLTDGARMNRFPDAMLYALIAEGNDTGMPGFSGQLNEAEMDALVAYLREIAPEAAESMENAEATTESDAESAAEGEEQTEAASDAETVERIGTISGTVMNGTGGDLPSGLVVELQAYDHDMMTGGFNEAFTLETPLENDGTYLFKEVEMREGRAFLTLVTYEDVSYSSEPDFITEGVSELEMPITFYETSTDTAQLSIDRMHIFIEVPYAEEEIVQMVEVFVISNPTLYAVVPAAEGEAVLEFVLPEGASNVQFEDSVFGERYTETADGFGDTAAILPGMSQHQVVVFFEMPYKRKLDFTQAINHAVNAVTVMVPQGMKIKSDYLTTNGEQEAQGLIYDMYTSQPLPVGATFEMSVSGMVSSSATGSSDDSTKNIIFGALVLGVVLIGAGVWFYLRGQNDDDYEDKDWEDEEEDEPLFDDAESIMDAIIALDDAYRAGDLSEDVYKKRRAALKEQLKELVD